MEISNSDAPSVKLLRLEKPEDFIKWKRRIKAYLSRDYSLLLGLSEKLENYSPITYAYWLKRAVRAKSSITFSVGDAEKSRTRRIVDDDDASAKDLLDGINNTYTQTNA